MNKKFLLSLLFGAMGLASFAGAATNMAKAEESPYDNAPAFGEVDPASYLKSIWNRAEDYFGAKRLGERELIATLNASYGFRATFDDRRYDLRNFVYDVDVSQMGQGCAMTVTFGTEPGSYNDGSVASFIMSFDIVRSQSADPTLYCTTVSTTKNHHETSIPSYTDGKTWAEDSHYTGVQANVPDGHIILSFHQDNNQTTSVRFNDIVTTVNNSELYANFDGDPLGYIAIGIMNKAGSGQSFIINKIGDSQEDEYFSSLGDYGICSDTIKTILATTYSSSDPDTILEHKLRFDAMPWSNLYSCDKVYLGEDYSLAEAKILEAIEEAGEIVSVNLAKVRYEALLEALKSLDTVAGIDAAVELNMSTSEALSAINYNKCTPEQKALVDQMAQAVINSQYTISAAMEKVYGDAVKAFEDAANGNITSGEALFEVNKLRNAIPTKYNQYLEESVTEAFAARILTASEKIDTLTTLTHNNWVQGATGRVIRTNKGFDLYSYGKAMDTVREESSGVYCKEKIPANNFTAVLNFKRFGGTSGSWFTFGIMENCDMWVYDDRFVQDNKGIFFLITKISDTRADVQAFLRSLNSTRFYDDVLQQHIEIPINQDVEVKFEEVTRSIAGVEDTYFDMSFNGVKFDADNVTARRIKTVLTDNKKGYFFAATSGYTLGDPALMSIKSINGKDPLAESIAPEVTHQAPTSTDTSKTIKEKTTSDVKFNLDVKGEALASVTIDNVALSSSKYSLNGTTLTINNSAISTLSVGDHTIKATTLGGSVTWTLKVESAGGGSGSGCSGCSGSIIATSVIGFIVAGAGIFFLAKRKKED